jgi:hypothetical protein
VTVHLVLEQSAGVIRSLMDCLDLQPELATAVAMLGEMGMSFWLPEAERELAEATR